MLELLTRVMRRLWSTGPSAFERQASIAEDNKRFLAQRAFCERLEMQGFKPWMYHYPPSDGLVECINARTERNFEIVPAEMPPMANIADLYWRPARPMKVIDAERPMYLH